jgi:hypothetical protein
VVTQATVTLENSSTGFSRSTKTNGQGEYEFVQIPPATYTISAAASGFGTARTAGVQLLLNTPATQNFNLTVAGAAEVVEVQGTTELVNTQEASIGNPFESKQLLNLPSEGRDAVWILRLQPGVSYVGGKEVDQSYDSRGGSVNGARSDLCLPSCSVLGPNAYFDSQYSLLYGWRSTGNAAYNGLQLMLRRQGRGLDFDVNYTYSKSMDVGSNAERINEFQGFGFASQVINSWER